MNKSDQKILSRATDNLLVESQKNKEKLKKVKVENKSLRRKLKVKEEVLENQKNSYDELEKMLISMLKRYNRRCPCDRPEECESMVCYSLQPEEIVQVLSESSSDSE